MRYLKQLPIILLAAALILSCGTKKKEMTVQDFAKIDIEITGTDQKPESIEKVAQKYGYTLEQYQNFAEKVEKDQSLQDKLGEIRLGEQKEQL